MTITDYELDDIAATYATAILEEVEKHGGDPYDLTMVSNTLRILSNHQRH